MDDRGLIEGLLQLSKGTADLYLHGSLESTTSDVHAIFTSALSEAVKIQNEIYQMMQGKGWYQTQQVEQQKIDQAKQQYSQSSSS